MSYQHLSLYCCGILWYPCLYHRFHLQLSNFWKFSWHKKSCFDITSKISFVCSFEFKTWMSKGNTTKPSPSVISGCPNREHHCSLHFQVPILQMQPWLRGSGLCMASVHFAPVSALAFLTLFFLLTSWKLDKRNTFWHDCYHGLVTWFWNEWPYPSKTLCQDRPPTLWDPFKKFSKKFSCGSTFVILARPVSFSRTRNILGLYMFHWTKIILLVWFILRKGHIIQSYLLKYQEYHGALKPIKQILTDLKGEVDRNIIIVEDFSTPLPSIDRSSR